MIETKSIRIRFDEQMYLERYPDVAAAVREKRIASGKEHYKRHGKFENRIGCDDKDIVVQFDEEFYLREYPDVAKSIQKGIMPSAWDHYVRHGRREGRNILPLIPRLIAATQGTDWPQAAPSWLICDINNNQDKTERAKGILESLLGDYIPKKLLDYGCGEGHVATQAAQMDIELAMGYDLGVSGSLIWDQHLTTNWDYVVECGPYDDILIYDVLDHAEKPIQVLKNVQSVLSPEGTVHLVCHPWTARHGSHLYYLLNNAFVHLIFTEKELREHFDISLAFSQKVTDINVYEKWSEEAGLKVDSKKIIEDDVEPILRSPIFEGRLDQYKDEELRPSFIEYKLIHAIP